WDPPQPFQNAGFTQFHGTLPFSSFQGFDCFLAHGFWQEGFKTNQEFHAHAWSFSTMVSRVSASSSGAVTIDSWPVFSVLVSQPDCSAISSYFLNTHIQLHLSLSNTLIY